ncbi:MAG: hypothetical protein HUU57_15390 [Bdellovibrio sp.]|nr:hypothetical protein [Bdellovibrio sp.]
MTQWGRGDDCNLILDVEKKSERQGKCGPKFNQLADLQSAGQEISEDTTLSVLARYRLSKNACAISQLALIGADAVKKKRHCEDLKENIIKLSYEISLNERLKHQLKVAPAANKERISKRLKLNTGRVSVLQNSIHFGDTEFIKNFTSKYLHRITAKSLSIGAINSLSDIELMPFDDAEYSASCAKAYSDLLGGLRKDQKIYQQASEGQTSALSRIYKESIIQDVDLMTEFYQNEKDLKGKRQNLCELDAKYGSGAELRDQALFFGSIGATAFSAGVSVLGRTMFFAGVQSATKIAAARNLTALSIAKMAGSTALALNSIQALKTFDSCTQDTPEVNTKGSDLRCEMITAQDFAKQDCVLDGALALLGGGLSSKYAQEYIAKLGSKMGLIVPFKEDELRHYKNTGSEEPFADRIHFNELEARQHKLLSDQSIAEINKDKAHSIPGTAEIVHSPYDELIGRSLDRQELLTIAHAKKAENSAEEQKNILRQSGRFSDGEVYKILRHHVNPVLSERKSYQVQLNAAIAANKQKGITSVSLDKPGESRFATFENKMKDIEDKFIFSSDKEKNDFFYYRNLKKEDVDAGYKNSSNEELKVMFEKHSFDPRSVIEDEYRRVIKVAENLGTPEVKKLKHSYGHVDTEGDSNIFSLRLQPMFTPKPGGGVMQSNPRMRALLCKQPDGKIRVLAVYTKETFVDEETFPAYEKEVYKRSRAQLKTDGIKCVSPSG